MRISDEMKQAVLNAVNGRTYHEGSKDEWAEHAIKAVYPLIRQQALEDAALLFEAYERGANSAKVPPTADYRWVSKQIRNLKDKTNEAHNG